MQAVSRLYSRVQSRRVSRIDTAISSLTGTFARTGNAYLDGVSYAANTARFPNTAGTVGVLVEEGTTNLLTANQASVETNTTGFAAATGTVLSVDTTQGVNGSSCLKVVADGTTTGQGFNTGATQATATPSTSHTGSVYLWGVGTVVLTLVERNSGAFVGQTNSANITLTSTPTRYTVTRAFGATGNQASLTVTLIQQATTIYADCLQIEAKGYATQWHLPGSARNAETLTIPTAGILRPDRGTVIVRAYVDAAIQSTSTAARALFSLSPGANDLYLDKSAGSFRAITTNASNVSSTASWSTTPSVGWHNFGVCWDAGALKLAEGGAVRATVANPNIPSVAASDLGLGYHKSAGRQWGQGVAYVAIYDRALSDAEMAAATTGNLPAGYTALIDFRQGRINPKTGAPYRTGEWLYMGLDPRDSL